MAEVMTYRCPYCDREAQVGKPCPGCTKKRKPKRPERRPWHQDNAADGLDLPDDDFNYDEFIAREFGTAPHRKLGLKWYWWLLGVAILLILGASWIFGWP